MNNEELRGSMEGLVLQLSLALGREFSPSTGYEAVYILRDMKDLLDECPPETGTITRNDVHRAINYMVEEIRKKMFQFSEENWGGLVPNLDWIISGFLNGKSWEIRNNQPEG